MRRMYSKEQLQKLIDEVSRLIAIEELDKVVPVPSLDKAGYYMQVNASGTGYQLVQIPSTPLYCHPLRLYKGSGEGALFTLSALIFNNTATQFNRSSFKTWLENLTANVPQGTACCILLTGGYNDNKTTPKIIQSAAYLFVIKTGEDAYLYGVDGINVGGTQQNSISSADFDEVFPATMTFVDAVNRLL